MTRGRSFGWRRAIVYTHRWMGIAGGFLFILWFASGIVMMYARMPELTDAEREARQPPLDLASLRISPQEAIGTRSAEHRVSLSMLGARPVYRFSDGGEIVTVLGDSGERLEHLSQADALKAAARFASQGAGVLRYDAYLSGPDQWS